MSLLPPPSAHAPAPADRQRMHKVLILGLGDLGKRIAFGLARAGTANVVAAGRNAAHGAALARLASACARAPGSGDSAAASPAVRYAHVDALDAHALRGLLERERPDLIVQCCSLLSPWALFERTDPLAAALLSAGFALQLPAQLPVIHNLMRVLAEAGLPCPVINCSYPDVTNTILAALDLAPAIGIGNAGMVRALAPAALAQPDAGPLRLFAHHAHVGAAVRGQQDWLGTTPPPRVFLGDMEIPAAPLFAGEPLPQDKELNALSAAHALDIIDAMLPGAAPLYTSAPGPLGLPGGWPVRITPGHIDLDLPAGICTADVVPFQRDCARGDGVERIDADGTVHFTDRLRERVPARWRALAEPLVPAQALQRCQLLMEALKEPA